MRMRLTSADSAGAFAALQNAGITLYNPERTDELTWCFSIHPKDGKQVKCIAQKRGEVLEMIAGSGLGCLLISIRKRPVMVAGLSFLLFLSLWLPGRILFVQVEGNEAVPTRWILENAKTCDVYFGASGKAVRSQRLKDGLLQQIPQLQWAGVKTRGCVAVITVKERSGQSRETKPDGVCSLVAARDAVVTDMVVLKGNPLCKPGQAVKAGQVLISGYTDCGICIQAGQADGEVMGLTKRNLTAVTPHNYLQRTAIRVTQKKYSIIIGKKQINFYKGSGILGMSCAKIYEHMYITLPGGFRLPVSVVCEQWIEYETQPMEDASAEDLLSDFARQYVLAQTQAGRMEYSQQNIALADGCLRLDGVYGCVENIGMVRMEENLPYYGKSD